MKNKIGTAALAAMAMSMGLTTEAVEHTAPWVAALRRKLDAKWKASPTAQSFDAAKEARRVRKIAQRANEDRLRAENAKTLERFPAKRESKPRQHVAPQFARRVA